MNRRLLLLAALPLSAGAQTRVYRCGPEGKSLSDRPCEGDAQGKTPRPPEASPAEREAAAARTADEARQARALQQQRLQAERRPPPAPGRLDAPRPPEPAASKPAAPRVAGTAKKKKAPKREART